MDRFARLPYCKLYRTLARMRSLRLVLAVAGTLALTLCAIGIGLASQPRATSSELLNQRSSYAQDSNNTGWLCSGWANGINYCTAHRPATPGSTLVTHHAIRVPNHVVGKGGSVSVQAPSHVSHPANPPAPSGGGSVQNQIRAVFGGYANAALAVAACESGYNPSAYNASSGASGVFQFLASTWATTSYAGYSRFNAWANIHAAYQVFSRDGYSWREWQCKP
ncbi:MAG TPA: transglycosylase SLT domain-containing protein [Ktedonobacterales bacterium]|nr:transglycosylase SLT domain-containing protein [Ktedonobacterales bacterium]